MSNTAFLEEPTVDPDAREGDGRPAATGFSRLLEWLDGGIDSGGEKYFEMRRRLIAYFDRRNCLFADDLADETLDRIAATLLRDGTIAVTPQARYCYVVARFVLLEDIRRQRLRRRLPEPQPTIDAPLLEDKSLHEERLESLERCLDELKPDQRALIVEYYRDTGRDKIERRRELAKRLRITPNALGLRALRLRASLEARLKCTEQRECC